MVKPEWGAKHGCPKCGTRFYDLGKDDPVTCIECGYAWHPDPVLKSKQPIPFEEIQKKEGEEVADTDLADEDLDIDEDGDSPRREARPSGRPSPEGGDAEAGNGRGKFDWCGALAQLGERLHGMQEVSGSIPLGSTIRNISG